MGHSLAVGRPGSQYYGIWLSLRQCLTITNLASTYIYFISTTELIGFWPNWVWPSSNWLSLSWPELARLKWPRVKMATGRGFLYSAFFLCFLVKSHFQNIPFAAKSRSRTCRICKVVPALVSHEFQTILRRNMSDEVYPRGSKYLSARISYHPNSEASFNLTRIAIRGDVALNPGATALYSLLL